MDQGSSKRARLETDPPGRRPSEHPGQLGDATKDLSQRQKAAVVDHLLKTPNPIVQSAVRDAIAFVQNDILKENTDAESQEAADTNTRDETEGQKSHVFHAIGDKNLSTALSFLGMQSLLRFEQSGKSVRDAVNGAWERHDAALKKKAEVDDRTVVADGDTSRDRVIRSNLGYQLRQLSDYAKRVSTLEPKTSERFYHQLTEAEKADTQFYILFSQAFEDSSSKKNMMRLLACGPVCLSHETIRNGDNGWRVLDLRFSLVACDIRGWLSLRRGLIRPGGARGIQNLYEWATNDQTLSHADQFLMETLEGVTVTLVSINKRTLSKSIAVTHTFNFDGVSEEKRRIEQFSDNEITLFGRPCQGITKSCGSMDVSKWQDDSSGADESIGIYFFFPRNQMQGLWQIGLTYGIKSLGKLV